MPLALSLPAVGAIAAELEIQLYLARRIALSSVIAWLLANKEKVN
jgi:hypothetical protein